MQTHLSGGVRFSSAGGLGLGSASISPELCFGVHFFHHDIDFLLYVTRKQIPTILDIFDQGLSKLQHAGQIWPSNLFLFGEGVLAHSHTHCLRILWLFCAAVTE